MSLFSIKRAYKNAEELDESFFYEDNFKTSNAQNREGEGKFLGKYLSEKKLNILLLIIAFSLLILLGKGFYLQIIKGNYYSQLAEINRTREKPLPAVRGVIYDKNDQPLLKNVPFFDAFILPKNLSLNQQKREQQLGLIAQTVSQDEQTIIDILDKYPKNFKYLLPIKENLSYEEAILLEIKAKDITGLYIEIRYQRQYLYPHEFSQILGYEGKITDKELTDKNNRGYLLNDYIGKTGLELSYEDVLRGKYGKEDVEVDVAGHEKKVLSRQEPQNGENLVLTLDFNVQKKAEQIMGNYLKKFGNKRGSLVMLNPQTGEILALVSLPDFDNNLFAQGISVADYQALAGNEDQPLFNRTIFGEYPSGSVIKPVYAVGALNEGIVTDKTTFLSTGGIKVFDRWFFPDWAAQGHGLTNVYKAIAWSVNTYFYIIGGGYQDFKGLGVEGLDKYLNLFGLGQKTGIDLMGESTGLIPDPVWKMKTKNEEWYIGDTYHLAIGQGDLLVTPLQVANYTEVFANGGKLYKPYLVKEIFSNEGEKKEIGPELIKENFVNLQDLNIVKKAMRQTVTQGSAQALNNLNFEVSGKTGTAQWHTDKKTHAWFTGFAPYNNPEVVITVLVEEGGEGSAVSVPIARDILDWYFNVYKKGISNK